MALSPFSLDLDTLPLFFRYRDVVSGRGFAAIVETTGRALCAREDDEFLMAGASIRIELPKGPGTGGRDCELTRWQIRRMVEGLAISMRCAKKQLLLPQDLKTSGPRPVSLSLTPSAGGP